MKLVTVSEMIAIEKAADAAGHTYATMMEFAGRGLAENLRDDFSQYGKRLVAFVGKGNNGGDALVALDYLQQWGWDTNFILVGRGAEDDLTDRAVEAGSNMFVLEDINKEKLGEILSNVDVLLDGLLGTGIKLPLREPVAGTLRKIKQRLPQRVKIVAVDTPSGVDCDTGEIAPETLRADMTVTMAAAKIGHFTFPASDYLGELRMTSIGLPPDLPEWVKHKNFVVDVETVKRLLPERPASAHKGTFGTAIIAAGSQKYVGAALLAGEAAFRSGAGLVTIACPISVYRLIAGQFPEATWLPLSESKSGAISLEAGQVLLSSLGRCTGLLIGPGFGTSSSTLDFIESLLNAGADLPPMVVDADGLKLLKEIGDWSAKLPPNTVLTPHPGEMAVLAGLSVKDIQENRIATAAEYARKWGHIVVLKGAFTVVSAPDGRTAVVPISTPALARAGTGDVLAGIIVGLRAQGMNGFESAVAGTWIHARAGLSAFEKIGSSVPVLAGDVRDAISRVFREL